MIKLIKLYTKIGLQNIMILQKLQYVLELNYQYLINKIYIKIPLIPIISFLDI